MIKAVIFDFDGTLSDRQSNAYYLFKDYFRPFFKEMNDMEYEGVLQDLLTMDCNGTINVKFRMAPFIDKYNKFFNEEDYETFKDFYYEYMWKYCKQKPDTKAVLDALKGKYKLAILSNGQSKSQHDKIDYCDMGEYFDEILVSGDVGVNKPRKEVFEIMADRLGVKPEECVFVGDVFSLDIIGAIRANMTPVWIVSDYERPTSYQGIRITKLPELLDVLDKLK